MNDTTSMVRRLVTHSQAFLVEILATRNSERGQAMIEIGMVVGFVAILAMSLITALGDVTGGALAEVSQVLQGSSEEQTGALPSDAFLGPRIAD